MAMSPGVPKPSMSLEGPGEPSVAVSGAVERSGTRTGSRIGYALGNEGKAWAAPKIVSTGPDFCLLSFKKDSREANCALVSILLREP